MVVIDRRPPFLLPQRLADLLKVLAEDTPFSPDHIVGWKMPKDIVLRLNGTEGTRTKPRSVNNLVYRLRHAIEQLGGLDRRFVEVRRNQGVRFRLRRIRGGPDRF